MSAFFRKIWRLEVPERVRLFIWKCAHHILMTNVERVRRHLGPTALCGACRGGDESILHILRDCQAIAPIWRRLVRRNDQHTFFSQGLLAWLYENISCDREVGQSKWATVFGMCIWWSWKWRCLNVFSGAGKCRDRLQFLKDKADEVSRAFSKRSSGCSSERVIRHIAWARPPPGWIKINTDGASRGNPGLATAGGALRSENAEWIGGFSLHLGVCSAPLAELWGAYYGLAIAWEKKLPRVVLELDSELVVGFLKDGVAETHPLSFLVQLCHGFLLKNWTVQICHVYREANTLADGLANYAFSLELGLHLFNSPPAELHSLLVADVAGFCQQRSVRL